MIPTFDSADHLYISQRVDLSGYWNHNVVYKSTNGGSTWTAKQTTASGELVMSMFVDGSNNVFESIFLGGPWGQPLAGSHNWLTLKDFAKSDQLTYEYAYTTPMFQDTHGDVFVAGGTWNGGPTVPDTAIIRRLACLKQ